MPGAQGGVWLDQLEREPLSKPSEKSRLLMLVIPKTAGEAPATKAVTE